MQSNPKIIVLKMREIVYTLLLAAFVIMLIVCLILMFSGRAKQDTDHSTNSSMSFSGSSESESVPLSSDEKDAAELSPSAPYTPGIYTTPVTLGESAIDVEVTVNRDRINSIRLVNLNDAVSASYPLVTPSLEHITAQILEKQSLTGITAPGENRYTAQLLLSAVAEALELASKN